MGLATSIINCGQQCITVNSGFVVLIEVCIFEQTNCLAEK